MFNKQLTIGKLVVTHALWDEDRNIWFSWPMTNEDNEIIRSFLILHHDHGYTYTTDRGKLVFLFLENESFDSMTVL